jgi:hypothetical protein
MVELPLPSQQAHFLHSTSTVAFFIQKLLPGAPAVGGVGMVIDLAAIESAVRRRLQKGPRARGGRGRVVG